MEGEGLCGGWDSECGEKFGLGAGDESVEEKTPRFWKPQITRAKYMGS